MIALTLLVLICVHSQAQKTLDDIFSGPSRFSTPFNSIASPALVSIENFRGLPLCNGILIAPDVVLTAAHTVNGIQDNLYVRANSKVLGFGGQLIAVKKNCPVTGYNFQAKDNDIAILRLVSPVAGVIPAKLPTGESTPGINLRSVQGWGFNTQGALATVPIIPVSDSACKNVYGNNAVTASMECMSYGGPFSSCLDVAQGSPVLQGSTVVAINAALATCTLTGPPGVFTKIAVLTIQSDIDNCV